MRYLGSKTSALNHIFKLVSPHIENGSFCDPFGGIGTVGSFFKAKGFDVWTGDQLLFAHFFQIAKIKTLNKETLFNKLFKYLKLNTLEDLEEYLNGISRKSGWFISEYSIKRKFFTIWNAQRINGCLLKIYSWKKSQLLNIDEYAILISSLIESMDKVANTAGTYYAFLKNWNRKALKPFRYKIIRNTEGKPKGKVFNIEAKKLLKKRSYDVVYLDPPYNQRIYSKYYHLPESIALGEKRKSIHLSGIPQRHHLVSGWNIKAKAAEELEEILKVANYKLLIFHYSDDGIIPRHRVKEILSRHGILKQRTISFSGYTTTSKKRKIAHRIYILKHD